MPQRLAAEYEGALNELEKFFESEPRLGTPDAEHFDALTRAIAAYEERHWAVSGP